MNNVSICRSFAAGAAAIMLALPAVAEDMPREAPEAMWLTDAIRIEVTARSVQDCPGLVASTFNLPREEAGFGPLLPGVPAGYGPTCFIVPDGLGNGASPLVTGLATN